MDTYFPLVVLFCGLFLQASLQVPGAAQKVAKIHPQANGLKRMDATSWVFIIVGSLWAIQNQLA